MPLLQLWKKRSSPLYDGPWPRPGMEPFTADAWFTNPDARLRPVSPLIFRYSQLHYLPGDNGLTVTPSNFPALHARFQAMQKEAGIHPAYQLVIDRKVASKASVDLQKRIVHVDLEILNRSDFEGFQFWIGHELGHAWQHQHPNRQRIPIRDQRVSEQQKWDSEADIFARCLSGDLTSILRGMNGLSQDGDNTHAPRAARQGAVAAAHWSDCLSFTYRIADILPGYLRARPAGRQ